MILFMILLWRRGTKVSVVLYDCRGRHFHKMQLKFIDICKDGCSRQQQKQDFLFFIIIIITTTIAVVVVVVSSSRSSSSSCATTTTKCDGEGKEGEREGGRGGGAGGGDINTSMIEDLWNEYVEGNLQV